MNREGLADLADHMVDRARAFSEYRSKVMDQMEIQRERNMSVVVGAVAGSAISMMAIQPGLCLSFTAAALAAIGNCAYHKRQMTKKAAALSRDRLPLLTDVSEPDEEAPIQAFREAA